jgi:hypothetical protein
MERKTMIRWSLVVVVLCFILLVSFFVVRDVRRVTIAPADFLSCVASGGSILESFPRQCKTETGATFVEDIGNLLEKDSLIRVITPRPNEIVSAPVLIEGVARGSWFFEGSFPVVLETATGTVMARGFATALSEWMTESFVPFRATLEYSPATSSPAILILKKDNPSGLPEKDDYLKIPIQLKGTIISQTDKVVKSVATSTSSVSCKIGGCSSQLCVDENVDAITTCEFKAEYACYKNARCERQVQGVCGWTDTPDLRQCLVKASSTTTPAF